MRRHSDLWICRRLLMHARPFWPHIAGIFVLSLLGAPLALLTPLPLAIVVDSALGSKPLPPALAALTPVSLAGSPAGRLFVAIALLVLVTLLTQLRGAASALLETYTSEQLVLGFRTELFQRVQRLSFGYHDRTGTTDALYRIQYDAPAIRWVTVEGVIPFVSAVLTIAAMTYVTARLDWPIAGIAILVVPVLFLITQIFRQRIRREWAKVKAIESSTMSGVQETLSSLRVVRAFGQEGREHDRFRLRSEQGLRTQMRLQIINSIFGTLIGLATVASTAAVFYIGVRHIQSDRLTLGSLLLITNYLGQLYSPMTAISKKIADLQASFESAERTFTLLDQQSDVPEKADARPIDRAVGTIAFENVGFEYAGGPEVLHGISFEVAAGDRVGIIGATGAGKTTLVSLLMRFYDPRRGRILLDGTDLRDFRLADLRSQFAIVLQEPVLFSTTIAENIAYAQPAASSEQIVRAARLANAHDFISRLPQGYATQVGERGMALSGGERQRIALARAFLKDAPLLILDEPTSSVDVATEAVIVDAMDTLMKGRTTFVIAHRYSALRNCNVRVSLQNGRLVGAGAALAGGAAV
jgi:ATP-binding cassette subfamily B protein